MKSLFAQATFLKKTSCTRPCNCGPLHVPEGQRVDKNVPLCPMHLIPHPSAFPMTAPAKLLHVFVYVFLSGVGQCLFVFSKPASRAEAPTMLGLMGPPQLCVRNLSIGFHAEACC